MKRVVSSCESISSYSGVLLFSLRNAIGEEFKEVKSVATLENPTRESYSKANYGCLWNGGKRFGGSGVLTAHSASPKLGHFGRACERRSKGA